MKVIILAGGSGTRLWPLSREHLPKQFLKFDEEYSLLQKTLQRYLKRFNPSDILILTQKKFLSATERQAAEISPALKERIVIEPSSRSTLSALLLGLKWLEEKEEIPETVLVAPSDHFMAPEERFLETLPLAAACARTGFHVLFGIEPTHPHTGYGYIECEGGKTLCDVFSFVEKPKAAQALSLFQKGTYLWNAGIFVFHIKTLLQDLFHVQPAMHELMQDSWEDLTYHFNQMPSLSIDHGLLERVNNIKVIPLHMRWSDIGSWDNFFDHMKTEKKLENNVLLGNVVAMETSNCLVVGGKRLVGLLGVEDLIVVQTEDALLVTKRGRSEQIKTLFAYIEERSSKETSEHPTVYRPWGCYTILEEGASYKIKRLTVDPKQKLSLQLHHHRSEHWVVVKGVATITIGENEEILQKNESCFIPVQTLHRLENAEEMLLEIIEVQVGDYLGEDDIVRFEDIYGRLEKVAAFNS